MDEDFKKYSTKKEIEDTIENNNKVIDQVHTELVLELKKINEKYEEDMKIVNELYEKLAQYQADNYKLMQDFYKFKKQEINSFNPNV